MNPQFETNNSVNKVLLRTPFTLTRANTRSKTSRQTRKAKQTRKIRNHYTIVKG